MEYFEKVEKLVEKAGVTYEEAKAALDMADGDLLDAMILLERAGKTAGPKNSTYSTKEEEQVRYLAEETGSRSYESGTAAGEKETFGKKLGVVLKKLWYYLSHNYLLIERKEETVAKLPLWAALLLLLLTWWVVLILLIVSLFFGYTYHFLGEADMRAVNDMMDKASDAAGKVRDEFKNS